jgi:anti-sigma regulatory factor (Ser/Thr protein kinase)
LAAQLRFDEAQAGKIALVVTEASTNVIKHAGRGRAVLRPLERDGVCGIELLVLDNGPGISNLTASLRDGHSTSGTLGAGLGALTRLADHFQIYTRPGQGTALRLEIWSQLIKTGPDTLELGAVCVAKQGEAIAGDAWTTVEQSGAMTALVADGLGHGPDAYRAARAATEVLAAHPKAAPLTLIEDCHAALRTTRGAAVSIAHLSAARQTGVFAGVGNVVGRIETPPSRRNLVSYNGTLGHTLRKAQEFAFPFPHGALAILHSDGLGTHWDLASYPGLATKHAGLIAGVLYRDYDRGRDDVTVVVVRNAAGDQESG